MPRIAMAAYQTRMPGNTVAAQKMTMPHIKVAARQKISWLLHCLPLHRPLILLLYCPLAAPADCCMASVECCRHHQTPPPPISIVHRCHRRRCRCHTATTSATATTAVEITIVHGQRKRQQQHHHQRTNGSTNMKTLTSPDDLDLGNVHRHIFFT
jgi:hypothetical protein